MVNTARKKETKKTVKKEAKLENDMSKSIEQKDEIKYQKSSNKPYVGYNNRLIKNVFVILLFFILSLVFAVLSVSLKKRSNITYTQISDIDYKVYLKPNDYYNQQFLGKNMQYIASLIDNINTTFTYSFNSSQNINYKYMYYVKADVSVESGEGKSVIYSKTDRITDPKIISRQNSNGFTINENIKIDYQKYNDLVKGFKSSYAISAESNLKLSLIVDVEDEKGNKIGNLNSKEVVNLTVPLTEQMVSIAMDYKGTNNSNNASVYTDVTVSNKLYLAIAIVSFAISVIFLIKLFKFISKTSTKRTIYDVTLSKILKEYDRVIVNSKNIVLSDDNIVDVNSFNELLDVRDNLEKPIIFSEIHKGQKSLFIVKSGDETYRYVMKLVDLEEENNKNADN